MQPRPQCNFGTFLFFRSRDPETLLPLPASPQPLTYSLTARSVSYKCPLKIHGLCTRLLPLSATCSGFTHVCSLHHTSFVFPGLVFKKKKISPSFVFALSMFPSEFMKPLKYFKRKVSVTLVRKNNNSICKESAHKNHRFGKPSSWKWRCQRTSEGGWRDTDLHHIPRREREAIAGHTLKLWPQSNARRRYMGIFCTYPLGTRDRMFKSMHGARIMVLLGKRSS